jgi:intracellular multiplication protein IcmO
MIRGVEKQHEQDATQLLRDTRTLGTKIREFLKQPSQSAIVFVVLAAMAGVFPSIADIVLICGFILSFYCLHVARRAALPFRLPIRSKSLDYNDLKPGGGMQPNVARGICFIGNAKNNNDELWFNNDDMRTHMLIFGSTGSGKTEALISFAFNALMQGSGFIYVDGKGDNSLYAKIFSMCRSMGREDDVLLINFMTGARDIIGAQETKLSNTMNPFSSGSSSMLIQLVVSLMGESQSGSPDGDMWKNRAINFVEALMKLLVYVRDQGKLLLDANSIRNYFHLPKLEQICLDRQFPVDGQEPFSIADAPPLVMDPINNYLLNLPGFTPKNKGKQVSQVLEQHGFITMQLTRTFGSLADTYSHIIRTNVPEVDMADVVLNRRILVVLLPALEKSPDELSNLGKIIIATLRAMMASGLGDSVEGRFQDVIQRKPTNAPTPYMCILDEYGYYAVKGFAVVPAQARSLGFSTIFAGQDLPAFQKASKEEAASIGANTNIKICMKLEDPTETWDFFNKTAGEIYVTKVDHFQTDSQSMMNNYLDTKSASAEKRGRIHLLDLKDQDVGEMHVFFKSEIVRARAFFSNPKIADRMRLNHFLKVDKPNIKELVKQEKQLIKFTQLLEQPVIFNQSVESSETIVTISKVFASAAQKQKSAIECSVAAFLACCEGLQPGVTSGATVAKTSEAAASVSAVEVDEISDRLNVFVRVRVTDSVRPHFSGERYDQFCKVLLVKSQVREKIDLIERLMGRKANQANNIALEMVRDIEVATDYPPAITVRLSVPELVDITQRLVTMVETQAKGNGES